MEEPPKSKEFFDDLCAVPNLLKRRFPNSRRSTHYCEALNYSRKKLPVVLSKMTLQELRHNMSTFFFAGKGSNKYL
ncbi:BGP_1a_G0048710.mRNA.1.CDS.1 [Saccharomyces cerevisiae]|nr:BGP_1a_G0048710.mRNA.1.CDS.1 [Saccharomyces cerevisiae]CAI7298635.1 BGP_1a_G0048710.mRNA.1.CDS.1 [Saccharomyces cerevisiae]